MEQKIRPFNPGPGKRKGLGALRKDHRPYSLKRLYVKYQKWYTNYFLRPQFEYLGRGVTFMKPWHVEIFGGPIRLGDYANVIAASDKKVRLTVWSTLERGGSIHIGDYCLICPGVRILAATDIFIGDSVMLAQSAQVSDSDWHGLYDRCDSVGQTAPVHIGNNVWIGDSAIVCKGVTVGENSIIGASAVVVKDIPDNVIAVGNPAVVVRQLDANQPYKTRKDWFANPRELAAQFEQIDRQEMEGNTWAGWIRSIILPRKGD
ncbi:MAG: acyltransferase [Syntrophales bacterium]|jgi:acetyltransferase-like isoleucine patch superfamily enzyme